MALKEENFQILRKLSSFCPC